MGSWLVLGGTKFLSRAVAAVAVARGHDVVCAARGESGPVPAGARLLKIDRDEPDGLAPLRGHAFDAVVDVSVISHRWVVDALDVLGERTGHWTFVSTMSVYADPSQRGGGVDDELVEPRYHDPEGPQDFDAYPRIKVASEQAVLAAVGERALVVRPGLLVGPGDASDRFGYWANRFARGGRTVVPDALDQPLQILDVRDLAEWIVLCGEKELTGIFDTSGPTTTLGAVLDEIAAAVGAPDLERVPVAPERLLEAGIGPWSGPCSLPLWLPPSHLGVVDRDTGPAREAGLTTRPVAESAAAAIACERALGMDRVREAGLDDPPGVESDLLH